MAAYPQWQLYTNTKHYNINQLKANTTDCVRDSLQYIHLKKN